MRLILSVRFPIRTCGPPHSHSSRLSFAPRPSNLNVPLSCVEAIEDGSWLQSAWHEHLCSITHGPARRPLNVIGVSLFDGIGAFWELFAPFVGTAMVWAAQFSCEVAADCLRVLEHRPPPFTAHRVCRKLGPGNCRPYFCHMAQLML